MVFQLPEGQEEPHVEFSYDLRGSDRESLHCVHGNHARLAGFVMKKQGKRFLVGHQCGEKLYGESFKVYKKDYDAARDRQDILRRVREVKEVIAPFQHWMIEVSHSNIFALYDQVRKQFRQQMGWLSKHLEQHTNCSGGRLEDGFKLPNTLFDGFSDPHEKFKKTAAEISKLALLLVGKMELEKDVRVTFGTIQMHLRNLEEALDQLREVEEFFQPVCLSAVCDEANQLDNRGIRAYEPGFLSITFHREIGSTTIQMPRDYKVPDRALIAAFRAALNGFA